MAERTGATEDGSDASLVAARERNRERQKLRYQKLRSDPVFLERNRLLSKARREKFGRPKRTPEQRAREREQERLRYAATKSDPEHVAARRAIRKARRDRDPEKKRAYDRKWLAAHKDDPALKARLAKNYAAYVARHPGRVQILAKMRSAARPVTEECREKRREWDRLHYAKIKDSPEFRTRNRLKPKAWREKHPGWRAEYTRVRTKTDPIFRVLCSLRSRMRAAVRMAAAKKADRTVNLLGCSLHDLRRHLESQFRDGMTWENYGKVWHVDHVRPCCTFDMSDPAQQAECFHWTNLQPLLAHENLTKPRPPIRRKIDHVWNNKYSGVPKK